MELTAQEKKDFLSRIVKASEIFKQDINGDYYCYYTILWTDAGFLQKEFPTTISEIHLLCEDDSVLVWYKSKPAICITSVADYEKYFAQKKLL